jgi:hypothetical protein
VNLVVRRRRQAGWRMVRVHTKEDKILDLLVFVTTILPTERKEKRKF